MRKIIVQILIVCTSLCAYAQIPTMPRSMLSPNAASLGEYGEVPVSPFTGIPQIEIPIYEIKVGDYTLPISMSYHAGGVRPDQRPGWTGLGWTLNAGGCISRVVNDIIDEYHNIDSKDKSQYVEYAGFYYKHGILDTVDWNKYSYLYDVAITDKTYYDIAPDKFSFNFMGYNGSFILNEKGEWKVQCDKPIKVIFGNTDEDFTLKYARQSASFNITRTEINDKGASHSFKKFTLVTEDGTQYVFGGNDNAIEYSTNFYNQNIYQLLATSWYLTKIILPGNTSINFTYERGDFIAQMYISIYSMYKYLAESNEGWFNPGCFNTQMPSLIKGYQGQLIYPTYLKLIEYPEGRIEFNKNLSTELKYDFNMINNYQENVYNGHYDQLLPILQYNGNYDLEKNYPNCLQGLKWYRLYSITIKDYAQNYVKTYGLRHNNDPKQRLILNSLVEFNTSTIGKVYKFEYDHPELLPDYVANKTDHWGFYNDKYAYYDNIDLYSSYREPNPSVSTYGTLNKIIYPTGGYTRFIFEPHTYMKYVTTERTSCDELSSNLIAGGLRVKEIINSSTGKAKDEVVAKRYYYVSDYFVNKGQSYRSSGILASLAKYNFKDYTVISTDNLLKSKMNVFSTQSVLPGCANSMGRHVGYSEVIEEYPDKSFSRYKYTNFDDGHVDEKSDVTLQVQHTVYEPYSAKDQERGLLKLKEDYDKNSRLKHSLKIDYEKDDNSTKNYVRTMKASYTNVCPGISIGYVEGTVSRIYTYLMRKIKETEEFYEKNQDLLKLTKTYTYNRYKMVSTVAKTINNGNTHLTRYQYPTDIYNTTCLKMSLDHVYSKIIELTEEILNPSGLSIKLNKTSSTYTDFGSKRYLPTLISKSNRGWDMMESRTSLTYDKFGNTRSIITDDFDKTIYIWGYNYQYLIAEIKKLDWSTLVSTLGEETIKAISASQFPDMTVLDNLRTKFPGAHIYTYKYALMVGVILKTDPKGINTHYEYDILGRLVCVKDHNGNIIETYNYKYKK